MSAETRSSTSSPVAPSYDVIVVGARAAGAATAILLARAGLHVLVVERSAPGSDTLSTHALMRGGVMQLNRWGLLDTIIAVGTPAIRRTSFTYADQRIDISIKPSHGVDALYAPRRTLLDATIAQAALQSGADVRFHTAATELLRDHRRARVTGVRIRTTDGRRHDVRAALVVGADGVRSMVADQAGAAVRRRARHTSEVTYGYWSGLETTGYEWVFRADACSGVIPTNDGRTCVFAGARPGRIGRGGTSTIERIVAQGDPALAERLARATPPLGTRTWAGHRGYVRQAHGPGWALVGDAGYFKDPISAHGLTDALRDAELLARAVIRGFGDDISLNETLDEFEALRDRLSLPLFETVDRIASNDWDDAEIAELLIQLSSAMAEEVDTLATLDLEPVS
jgi:2-polyprenyl-6-methoxyphenol hydroxylase-like FAD-dependent oxidoreductase